MAQYICDKCFKRYEESVANGSGLCPVCSAKRPNLVNDTKTNWCQIHGGTFTGVVCPLCTQQAQLERNDMVNHPTHYTTGGIECIDAIKASMSADEFKGYLKGNVIKYMWRYRQKGGVEDLKKANFYNDRLIKEWENAPK